MFKFVARQKDVSLAMYGLHELWLDLLWPSITLVRTKQKGWRCVSI